MARRNVRVRWTFGVLVTGLICALSLLEAAADPHTEPSRTWVPYIEQANRSIRANDFRTAVRALQGAYVAALASGRWEGLVEYGDAMLRVADAAGLPRATADKARRAYLMALLRARDCGCLEGILRSAEGFNRLGDWDGVGYAMGMAQRLAAATDAARIREHEEAPPDEPSL